MVRRRGSLKRLVLVFVGALVAGTVGGYASVPASRAEARRCQPFGRGCKRNSDCCRPLECVFDGYTRWCRFM
jgi:hypothetical protein